MLLDQQYFCRYILRVANSYWANTPCRAFDQTIDNSAIALNHVLLKPKTWNILEFKLNVFLLKEGRVTFTYKKVAKVQTGYTNGRFRFFIGFYSYLYDDDITKTAPQTMTYTLKQGFNELVWHFAVNTNGDTQDLNAEISVHLCSLTYR